MKWVLVAVWCLFFVLANLLAKRVAVEMMTPMSLGAKILNLVGLPQAWLMTLCYLGCAVLYLWLLAHFPMSIILPLCLGLGVLLVMGIGIFLENEVVGRLQLLGACCCVIGIVLIRLASD